MDLLNALPRPVTVACFLESLERPLYLNATKSFISLQPAVGLTSPRLFLMFEGMSLSVVPEGSGSKLIEFGEFVTPERTLKAEVGTPITARSSLAIPTARPWRAPLPTRRGTTCRTCHGQEERAEEIPFAEAFHSLALRPDPRTVVTLESVRAERDACPDRGRGRALRDAPGAVRPRRGAAPRFPGGPADHLRLALAGLGCLPAASYPSTLSRRSAQAASGKPSVRNSAASLR